MPLDRYGRQIYLGWSRHQELWVLAALELPTRFERWQAYNDIADMTGRTVKAVSAKACKLHQARLATQQYCQRLFIEVPTRTNMGPKNILPPSQIAVDPNRLRAGR